MGLSQWKYSILSAFGLLPLSILGLITPSQTEAFLAGIADITFGVIAIVNAYDVGYNNNNNK